MERGAGARPHHGDQVFLVAAAHDPQMCVCVLGGLGPPVPLGQ